VATLAAATWYESTIDHDRGEQLRLLLPAITVAAGAFTWAGLWALAGKLLTGRGNFVTHANIGWLGVLLVWLILDPLQRYLAFGVSSSLINDALPVTYAAGAAFMVYRHLRLVSRQSRRWLATAAVTLACLGLSSLWVYERVQVADDMAHFPYLKELKAPGFRLVSTQSPEEFVTRAAGLKGELDALRKRD
jgi:hypothetical protein